MKQLIDSYINTLAEDIESFRQSDKYQNYHRYNCTFPDYDFDDSVAIFTACPSASYVACPEEWERRGRRPKPGAIPIALERESGVEQVYDITQTEGAEPPSIVTELQGDVPGFEKLYAALIESEGATVGALCGGPAGTYGLCDSRTGLIQIRKDISQKHTIKTLVHELLHRRAHGLYSSYSRNAREVQAESVAHIVCKFFGVDTSDYSLGYLLSWMDADETLEAHSLIIRRNALSIIEGAEPLFSGLKRVKTKKGRGVQLAFAF